MTKHLFEATEKVEAWLGEQPPRGKTAAINAALESHIAQDAEAQASLELLRQAVDALDNLHLVVAALVDEITRWRAE